MLYITLLVLDAEVKCLGTVRVQTSVAAGSPLADDNRMVGIAGVLVLAPAVEAVEFAHIPAMVQIPSCYILKVKAYLVV